MSGKFTFLPELYDIFGREATIQFLEIFAGCKIRVPKVEKLASLARDSNIFFRIERISLKQRHAVIKQLAEEYEVTEDRIRSIHQATKTKLDELGFTIIQRGTRRG